MRTGLIMLATAATLGTAAIGAAPASAQYYGYHDGYRHHHHGWDRGDRWDRHREWRREHWRHERAREWRHHHRRHGYDGYYGY